MSTETWPPRCPLCNLFISYKDLEVAVRWTPYGNTSMTEPPPEEFAHLHCWKAADESRREMIRSIAWAKPYYRLYSSTPEQP